jgi:hypothetical protein
MLDAVNALLLVALSALGAGPVPSVAGGVVAVALVAVSVLALVVVAVGAASAPLRRPAHPSRAMAPSRPLAQSDPDASGHPRPRAPGHAAPAV